MNSRYGGFLQMTFGVIAVVLIMSLFASILGVSGSSGLIYLLEYANISTFTGLSTVIAISATVLLLGMIFASSYWGYYKGYQKASSQDAAGVLRLVFGIVQIILFISLFYTIMTSAYTLYSHTNASSFTAFTTVVAIVPTVLFLGGIFSGAATSVAGGRAISRRRRRLM